MIENKIKAKKIKETFWNNIEKLDTYQAMHFAWRMFRVSKDKKCIPFILKYLVDKKKSLIEKTNNIEDKNYISSESQKIFNRFDEFKNKKMEQRKKILGLKEHIETLFWRDLSWITFIIKAYNLEQNKDYKVAYEKALKFLKRQNFEKDLFENSDLLKYDAAQVVNEVYFLNYTGVVDLREKLVEKFKKVFMNSDDLPDFLYINKMLGLTHFVFADSAYYEHFVENPKKFDWIFEYFENNIDKIISKTQDVDLVAEVGACCWICKKETGWLFKAEEFVKKSFDEKRGMIIYGDRLELNKAEHVNTVSYLLFEKSEKLFKGPNLNKI